MQGERGMERDDSREVPSFEVIVPAYRAEETIGACLAALFASGFSASEITVVDDGSPDRTGGLARDAGVRVVANETPTRPARARNRAAEHATADVLVFVDADVVVHGGLRERLETHFSDESLVAVIGSYDDAPAAPSVISRYRNLLHHITHQDSAGRIATFWSGLGAVRRSGFDAVGGFDPRWEDIEDVEFGLRLSAEGARILLDPRMLSTHLKDWTLVGMFRTDLFGRAVPWTRLLRSGRMPFGTLNTSPANAVSAAAVGATASALVAATVWTPALWVALCAAAVFFAANLRLLTRLARVGGVGFAIRALPYHVIHNAAALLGFAKVRFFERGLP